MVDFVQKIEQSKKPLDGNEREIVLVYKKKYINSLSTLKEVSSAFQQFNFKPIGGYSEDFYTSIDRNNEVLIQSIKNENSYFLPDTKKFY